MFLNTKIQQHSRSRPNHCLYALSCATSGSVTCFFHLANISMLPPPILTCVCFQHAQKGQHMKKYCIKYNIELGYNFDLIKIFELYKKKVTFSR